MVGTRISCQAADLIAHMHRFIFDVKQVLAEKTRHPSHQDLVHGYTNTITT